MVLVVERFEDFKKIVERFAIRGYVVYDRKQLNSNEVIYKISCGKLATIVSVEDKLSILF